MVQAAFAGQHRPIDLAGTISHFTIHGNPPAGQDQHEIAHGKIGEIHHFARAIPQAHHARHL